MNERSSVTIRCNSVFEGEPDTVCEFTDFTIVNADYAAEMFDVEVTIRYMDGTIREMTFENIRMDEYTKDIAKAYSEEALEEEIQFHVDRAVEKERITFDSELEEATHDLKKQIEKLESELQKLTQSLAEHKNEIIRTTTAHERLKEKIRSKKYIMIDYADPKHHRKVRVNRG